MFKRMIFEDWAPWFTLASFLMVFLVFLLAVVRALAADRGRMRRMALLPVNDGDEAEVVGKEGDHE